MVLKLSSRMVLELSSPMVLAVLVLPPKVEKASDPAALPAIDTGT